MRISDLICFIKRPVFILQIKKFLKMKMMPTTSNVEGSDLCKFKLDIKAKTSGINGSPSSPFISGQ